MPNPVLRRVPRDEMTPRLQAEYDTALHCATTPRCSRWAPMRPS